MVNVHNSEFLTIDFDNNKSILIADWKPKTTEMTTDDFKIDGSSIIRTALENKASYIVGDNTKFFYAIAPEIQSLMSKNVIALLNNSSVKKVALVESPEIIEQLGIEQMFEELVVKTYEDRYFDNIHDTIEWCKE